MLVPRKYQREATDAIMASLAASPYNTPLVDMATGVGKSLVIAMTAFECIKQRNAKRIIVTAPSKELVRQNNADAHDYNPDLDTGIYCAGLGEKDLTHAITYGTINSLVNATEADLGTIDVLIIDECHKVNIKALGMYRDFIVKLKAVNPKVRVVGLTATPFRLDGGFLTDPLIDQGEPLFTEIVYTFGLREGIADGYLVPLRSFQQTRAFDETTIKKQNGDFNKKELQAAWTSEKIEEAVKNLMIALEQDAERTGKKRKHILAFCCGIQNAEDISNEATKYGITSEHISGEMSKAVRSQLIDDFKNGDITLLTNSDILTTGFNAKNCDCIVQFRNTLSTSLYIQMLGRGTRTYFTDGTVLNDEWSADHRRSVIADSAKPDCLVLDFTNNSVRHGPVEDAADNLTVKENVERGRICFNCEAINKYKAKLCCECGSVLPELLKQENPCPSCGEHNKRNAAVCNHCGYDLEKHAAVPYDRLRDLFWDRVGRVHVAYHSSSYMKPPTMRVEYYDEKDDLLVKEWISLEPDANSWALKKGRKWWLANGGKKANIPGNVEAAIATAEHCLTFPTFVSIELNDKGFNVIKDKRYDIPPSAKAGVPAKSQPAPEPTDVYEWDVSEAGQELFRKPTPPVQAQFNLI